MAPQIYLAIPDRRQEVVLAHLQENLGQLGIEIESHLVVPASFQEKIRTDRHAFFFRFGWCGDVLDPVAYLIPLFHSQGKSNFMGYSNPEVDRLLDSAAADSDPMTRLVLYRRAESILVTDAPCVPLFQRTETILLRPAWKGIPIGYNGAFMEIEKVRWESGA
jgi:ABC-type oligopeptide transport system substrate-binding subunit